MQASDNGRFTVQAMNAAGIKQSTCVLIVAPAPTPIPGVKSVALVSFEFYLEVLFQFNFYFLYTKCACIIAAKVMPNLSKFYKLYSSTIPYFID